MEDLNQNKPHKTKSVFLSIRNWIMDHSKLVMPVVLVVCVLITISVALNANQREALEKEAAEAALAVSTQNTTASVEGLTTPVYDLEENAYPEVNHVVETYYAAQADGDTDTISAMNSYLDEIEIIRVREMSKYIENYPELNVYTKPGLSENSYVAYVCSKVKFVDEEQTLPGLKIYYIGQNEDGSYFINDGSYDASITSYIKEVTLQDDVVDLNNQVVVEYNELLASDESLEEYVAFLKEKINEEVGEILAEAEVPADSLETEEETEATEKTTGEVTVVTKVKATDVVNIRTSDSENADKIGKAQVGQEFTLLEQKGNGWSKIEYNGKEAYIKSDYLEASAQETVISTGDDTAEETDNTDETEDTETASADTGNDTVSGTVTVIDNVKVRKGASTSADSLGTAYVGEKLELIQKQSDGWTKVKYKGNTAYVKSDYVK